MDIQQALYNLGEITGEIHNGDLLQSIFIRLQCEVGSATKQPSRISTCSQYLPYVFSSLIREQAVTRGIAEVNQS